jgi:hypothetical protein
MHAMRRCPSLSPLSPPRLQRPHVRRPLRDGPAHQ